MSYSDAGTLLIKHKATWKEYCAYIGETPNNVRDRAKGNNGVLPVKYSASLKWFLLERVGLQFD